jgi:hypothetical protein
MDCQEVIESYLRWIRDNTVVTRADEGEMCVISTPFLDRHNDHLDVFLTKSNGIVKISDDGYTMSDLRMSGLEINSPKRESILRTTLNGFGVKLGENDELYVEATQQTVGQKKHYLLQAILAVNDMFNLAQESIFSLFKEDVELYFKSHDVIYSKDIKLSGKSGFDHNIDFLSPSRRQNPERLVKAVNTPKKDQVTSAIWAFNDISQARDAPTRNIVIYNDTEKTVPASVVDAMTAYEIMAIRWSAREQHLEDFSLN